MPFRFGGDAVHVYLTINTRGLADTWLHPTHAYTHAFREVDAQLSARERVVANLLLTEGRTA